MKNGKDVLSWANNFIFNKTGEEVTPIQEAIIQGVWEGKKYPEIAKCFKCSESYVKQNAAKLWKELSEELGEDLRKSNFRYKLEKKYPVFHTYHLGDNLETDNVNNYGECTPLERSLKSKENQQQKKSTYQDWGDAPDIPTFFGRETELEILKEWTLKDRCRLIAIIGIGGIGKTAVSIKLGKGGIGKTDLSLHLARDIQDEFEFVIWRSLLNAPPITEIIGDLIKFISHQKIADLSNTIDKQISQLLESLKNHRCLLILDNVESILAPGDSAGKYRPECEDYGQLLK
ncbi:MAG: ATP-binding protein [Okeania sp. SIO1H6]|nr:ATP-binding protein [Okeania sp. SIO1H6]